VPPKESFEAVGHQLATAKVPIPSIILTTLAHDATHEALLDGRHRPSSNEARVAERAQRAFSALMLVAESYFKRTKSSGITARVGLNGVLFRYWSSALSSLDCLA
jgi:hypothetical protein